MGHISYGEDAGEIRRDRALRGSFQEHREAGALRHRHAGGSLKGASPQAGEKRHRINRCNQAIAVLDKSVLHSSEKRYEANVQNFFISPK